LSFIFIFQILISHDSIFNFIFCHFFLFYVVMEKKFQSRHNYLNFQFQHRPMLLLPLMCILLLNLKQLLRNLQLICY
jgi:hypothetical protein